MILSFSVPEMRPMIRAGLRQRQGEDVGSERVKRQTYRKIGPRALALLAHARNAGNTIPYDLHLWWKSRTAERELFGVAECGHSPTSIKVFRVEILHSRVENPDGTEYQCCRIDGPRGWRKGDATLFWSPNDCEPTGFTSEAYADGFDSPQAFRDYFVPNLGDRFDAILFKW